MANLTSGTIAAAFATFSSDTITITRRSKSGPPFTVSTVYSGAGDLQEGGGDSYYNPQGAVEVSDAKLIVSASTSGALPTVEVGDTVTRTSDGKTFTVKATSLRTWQLFHLELQLKRGGLTMKQGGGRA